jgi:hypothetical protein
MASLSFPVNNCEDEEARKRGKKKKTDRLAGRDFRRRKHFKVEKVRYGIPISEVIRGFMDSLSSCLRTGNLHLHICVTLRNPALFTIRMSDGNGHP